MTDLGPFVWSVPNTRSPLKPGSGHDPCPPKASIQEGRLCQGRTSQGKIPRRCIPVSQAPGEGGGQSWAPLHVEQLGSFLRRPSVPIPGPPPRCPRPPHGASCGSAGLPDGSSLTPSSPGLRKKSSDWGQSPREVAEPPLPHPCSRTFCPGSRSGGGQEVGALGAECQATLGSDGG